MVASERLAMRVIKGALEPANRVSAESLRARHYSIGDIVFVEIRKPRNPGFHRLAHVFGGMVSDNIEGFEGMGHHQVLKRLQIEANIACDEIAVIFPGVGPCVYRIPQSLSFESMDEVRFREVFKGLCQHVAERYWPTLTGEQIEEMAETMVDQE